LTQINTNTEEPADEEHPEEAAAQQEENKEELHFCKFCKLGYHSAEALEQHVWNCDLKKPEPTGRKPALTLKRKGFARTEQADDQNNE
jgi:ribosomal protein L37AE/L43A